MLCALADVKATYKSYNSTWLSVLCEQCEDTERFCVNKMSGQMLADVGRCWQMVKILTKVTIQPVFSVLCEHNEDTERFCPVKLLDRSKFCPLS